MVDLDKGKNRLEFRFPELHPNAGVNITFKRTLRLPDDGNEHFLPPGLGSFPLRHVEDFNLGNQEALKSRGGIIMPMFQADALWLNFEPLISDEETEGYPVAIKIGTGKVCAVSGDKWTGGLNQDPQDYIVVPEQPWLDGYNVSGGTVRQFVAAPLGDGVTAEEQITGSADVGGIQIQVFPMKKSYFDEMRNLEEAPANYMMEYCASIEPEFMGLSAGGKMHQEIYEDPYEFSAWDQRTTDRCFITIANANQWMSITGEEPPLSPISADEYTDAGLPWFSYFDSDKKAIEGAKALGNLKSLQKSYAEKGNDDWDSESIKGKPNIVSANKRAITSGSW